MISISALSTGWRLALGVLSVASCFEADGVDGGVNLWNSEDLFDLVSGIALRHVTDSQPKVPRLLEAFEDQVADDDHAAPSSRAE